MADALTVSVEIRLGAELAFERFSRGVQDWWPRDYTWSGESLQEIRIEPRVGALCTEIGPHGFRCDFGRILDVAPGQHLVFTWQIGFDRVPQPVPSSASEVEVRFEEIGVDRTRVTLTHRHFARHGTDGVAYCAVMASERGWPFVLEAFAAMDGR